MTSASSRRIRGFDGLRAISVFLVILSHLGILGWASSRSPIVARAISVFDADFGVRTFFVLSGFLITSLLIAEHNTAGTVSLRSFIIRRAARILPLYLLIVSLAVFLVLLHIARPAWMATLFSALYIYNFLPLAHEVNYLNHLWSLAVEEQFYLFWPTAFLFLFGKRRMAINVFAIGVIATCIWRMYAGYGSLTQTYVPSIWTIPAVLPIMVGCLTALNIGGLARFLAPRGSLAISLILIGAPLYIGADALRVSLGVLGIGILIGWFYLNQESRPVRWLETPLVVYIGSISYGIYMWQGFLTGNGPYRDATWPPNIWIGAILTIPVAIISYEYFELPLRIAARRRGDHGVYGLRATQLD